MLILKRISVVDNCVRIWAQKNLSRRTLIEGIDLPCIKLREWTKEGKSVKIFRVIIRWSKRQVKRSDQRVEAERKEKEEGSGVKEEAKEAKGEEKEEGDARPDPSHLGLQGYSIYITNLAIFSLQSP